MYYFPATGGRPSEPITITVVTNNLIVEDLPEIGVIKVLTTSDLAINGLAFTTQGPLYRLFINVGVFEITLPHQSPLAVPGNGWINPGNLDVVLLPNDSVWLFADDQFDGWRTC